MNTYIMYGYGVTEIDSFLKEEVLNKIDEGTMLYDIIDNLEGNESGVLVCHSGEDIGYAVGIDLRAPYEESLFETEEECDNWIYAVLEPILRDDVKKEDLNIGIFSDYEIC